MVSEKCRLLAVWVWHSRHKQMLAERLIRQQTLPDGESSSGIRAEQIHHQVNSWPPERNVVLEIAVKPFVAPVKFRRKRKKENCGVQRRKAKGVKYEQEGQIAIIRLGL